MKCTSLLRTSLAVLSTAVGLTLHAQQQYQWTNFVGKPGGQGNVDGPALTKAKFWGPTDLVRDASGNLFIADSSNYTIRKITAAGVVSTLAGKAGAPGSVDGTGSDARFAYPKQMALAPGGVLYVADGSCIRKVTATGVVTTFAGSLTESGSTDGPLAVARFNRCSGLALATDGTLYVADSSNDTIRKITPAGVVSTLAGSAGQDGSADGSGAAARFGYPYKLALAGGFLFVTDYDNQTIRKVSLTGDVTTLAGLAGSEGSADGTGSAARFSSPGGIASDASGNLYVGQGDGQDATLRKITPAGEVTTLAGALGWAGHGHADGTGAAARFTEIDGLCAAPDGSMLLADSSNCVIRRVSAAGVVTTVAGSPNTSGWADGSGEAAAFARPTGIVVNGAGEVFVADTGNYRIRKVTPAGVVSTYAGTGTYGAVDGPAASAQFRVPTGLAVDTDGSVWVTDGSSYTVRVISAGGMVSTLAGTDGQFGNTDGTGAAARFRYPRDIVFTAPGMAFVADEYAYSVRQLTSGGVVTTVAGGTSGWLDGTGTAARFIGPQSICADAAGNLYVADPYRHDIRKITPGYVVTTLAGYAAGSTFSPSGGNADGTGTAARFNLPSGVAVNGAGTVFVADSMNHTIRRISSSGVVTTIGGAAGIADAANGMNGAARFSLPQRIAIGPDGTLYVTDRNNRIVKGVPLPDITVQQPVGVPLVDGKTLNFGPVTLTTTQVRTFTIRNDSDVPLTGLSLSVNGTHAAEFTATSLAVTSLAPGASTTFDITFHANVAGTRTAAVHITSNDSDESPFDIVLSAVADNNLKVDMVPESKLQVVGDSVTFQSHGSHPTLPVTYQWKKNGTSIKDATSSDLTLNDITPASAATYTVVMTAGSKSVSLNATLTVINPVPAQTMIAKVGSTVKLPVTNVKGPCVFLWKKNGVPLPNSNTSTLTLSAVTYAGTPPTYDCYALRADLTEVPVASFSLVVFTAKPILSASPNMPDGKVGSPYLYQIKFGSGANIAPTSFSASNLPPGVTVNTKTGLISGSPTLAKSYLITLTASNSYGTATITDLIDIEALPAGMVGTFNGLTTGKGIQTGGLNARVDFTVATTGIITGSTVFSGVKYPFTGNANTTASPPTATITIPRKGLSTIQLNLVFAITRDELDVSSTLSTGFNTIGLTGWRNVWRTSAPVRLATTAAKRFNFALNPAVTPDAPEGNGYGSFILNTNGTLTVAGKTPEGDSFTTSSFEGQFGEIMVYQALYANQGVINGMLNISGTDTLDGSLLWTRPANSTSRYSPNGFTKLSLTAYGARYIAPIAPMKVLNVTIGEKAMLDFSGGGLSTASINPNVPTFDILAGNKPQLPAALSAGNPGSVKITKLDAATGVFTGTFLLSDNELRTGTYAGKKFPRSVTFNGVLTQDNMGPVGAGYFLLPELPTNSTPPTKTVIRSGYVQMQKK